MSENIEERIREITKRTLKAVKGPFCVESAMSEYPHDIALAYEVEGAGSPNVVATVCCDDDEEVRPGCLSVRSASSLAEFFAHAREDIPWLLEQLDAERRKIEAYKLCDNINDADFKDMAEKYGAWGLGFKQLVRRIDKLLNAERAKSARMQSLSTSKDSNP